MKRKNLEISILNELFTKNNKLRKKRILKDYLNRFFKKIQLLGINDLKYSFAARLTYNFSIKQTKISLVKYLKLWKKYLKIMKKTQKFAKKVYFL